MSKHNKIRYPAEVTTLVLEDKGWTKATAAIRIHAKEGEPGILIQGIHIQQGRHALFVLWPSWREGEEKGGPRFPIVQIENEEERWAYEIRLLEAYHAAKRVEAEQTPEVAA